MVQKKAIQYVLDLYQATKNDKFEKIAVPKSLYPYTYTLYSLYKQQTSLITSNAKLIKNTKPAGNNAIFAFTGGKDSLATYLCHKDKYNNRKLVYVNNLSRMYPDEFQGAKKLASKLGENIKELNFNIDNRTWLQESVIKNQLIYALLFESENILPSAIGFGGTKNIGPQSMAFFHDSAIAFQMFKIFVEESWGKHTLFEFVEDEIESYKLIYQKGGLALLDMLTSCMSFQDTKNENRNSVKNIFGFKLQNKYSCGLCYKCAEEAVIMSEIIGIDMGYSKNYIKKCKQIILDKVFSKYFMNGYPIEYAMKLNLFDLN